MNTSLLVIDCATPALSIALFAGDDCLAAHHSEPGRGHAEALLPAIAALPDGGRADGILVDVGPGSFTGVRVGVAAAVALGFGWGVPVHGYGCLDLIATMVRDRFAPTNDFPVAMVGGHGELFWALCPAEAAADSGPLPVGSTPIADLAGQLDQPVIYGSGAASLVAARGRRGEAVSLLPDARAVILLAPRLRDLPARPIYGRSADARPMALHRGPPQTEQSAG
jgi:tRNA threonylcarbamoyl adenosine modification protein YeaZ